MSEMPSDVDSTIDQPAAGSVAAVAERFEAAWKKALRGGERPSIDAHRAQVPDADRTALNDELTRIDAEYRRRYAQAVSLVGAAVLNSMPSVPAAETPDSDTRNQRGGEEADATPNPTAIQDTTDQPPDGGTIGYMAAPADPSATMDHPPPPADATSDEVSEAPKRSQRRSVPEVVNVPGYEILGILGRGGMGVVYKAKHLKLKRIVALKMVLAGGHASETELARFYIEAEAVAQLQHPNIVQVFEISEQAGLPFFALEYVDGGSLSKKLDGKPQPPRDAARMVELLAQAMAYAHLHGIIHRDLKPANILLGSDGQPKITDFGLAKRLEEDSGQTKSGTLMGTPNYMAPEQARGDTKEVGPLADVYALGVILYQMITGRTPFVGTSILDTIQQVRNLEPVPPSRLQPKVPADLETICLKCLQKDPQKRYLSADDLADDLRFFLAGQAIRARPVSGAERLWRWCKRNPKVAGLSATVLALLATVAVTSSVMAVQIHRQKAAAEEARDLAQKNEDLAVKRKTEAEEARDLAVTQSGLALRAVRTLIDEAQKAIGDNPGMQALKGKLLETALQELDKVARTDQDSRLLGQITAGAYLRIGQLFKEMGQSEKALAQIQKCHDITSALAAKDPDGIVAQYNLAQSYTALGEIVVERGDILASLGYYQKALDIRKGLVGRPLDQDPDPKKQLDPVDVKKGLAESYTRMGVTYLKLGEPKKAGEYFQQALPLRQDLVDSAPTDTPAHLEQSRGFQLDLARSHNALAEVQFRSRDWAAAKENFEHALTICDRVVQANPQRPLYKLDLANTLGNFGVFGVRTGRLDDAQRHYGRYLALMQELADLDAKNALFQRYLGLANYRRATLARLQNDADTARRCNEKCLQIREKLVAADEGKSERRRIELMLVRPRCGQHGKAAEQAAQFRNSNTADREVLFELAECYAQCAAAVRDEPELSRQYRENAHEALTQALAQGYKDLVILETEPDLDALRDQPAFQALLATLKKGS